MNDTRRGRLSVACSLAGISLTDCATRLGVTRSALYDWARRGDPATEGLTLAHKASRARLGDEGPVTAHRIAAVLGCPPEALHPGGPVPTWGTAAPASDGDPVRLAQVEADVREAVALGDALQAQIKDGVRLVRQLGARYRRGDTEGAVAALEDLEQWAREVG